MATTPRAQGLSTDAVIGQALAHVDLVEKAVNEVDAKQNATAQLVQALATQMQALHADN